MESAVRYDFSFPPKSANLNQMNPCGMSNTPVTTSHAHGQQQQHTIHNIRQQTNQYQYHHNVSTGLGLSKSASTSLLSCATTQNNNVLKQLNNNYCYNCNNCNSSNNSNCTNGLKSKVNHNVHHSVKPTAYGLLQQQGNLHGNIVPMMAPATPKDSNCSFTFDDLKNTLAFMEDSPLINPNGNTVNMANANAVNSNQVLMVIPNASTVDCTSLSSSSSLSSSGSSTSSCSSTSYCAMNFIPKSNSNPMLSSSSSSNTSSNSPTTLNQPINKSTECVCVKPAQKSVLDLFIKKTPETVSYDSLITTTSLLANVQAAQNSGINTAIETAAKKYRCAAQVSEATCCWKGKLPPKQYKTPIVYSTKVFVGGLPWDITEDDIVKEFGVFGPCRVEWTNKEKFNLLSSAQVQTDYETNQYNRQNRSMSNLHKINQPNQQQNQDPLNSSKHRLSPGFAYVIYESEYSVRSLVGNCIEDYQNGRDRVEYYFKISTRRVRNKEVQIIPWILADNNFALCTPKELDPKKTVFVGNLHGTMTARDLAHIMNELFGCVVYAGIDIDKLKYPIGSGRVTFSHQQNFMRAVRAAFVDIQSSKFSKRIQIDPYLEDVQCCSCYNDKGIYFCRDFQCFNYYCGQCWDKQHSYNQLGNHKPLMRKREDKF